jgi:DNA-binding Xre family transcriptional regulator
MRGDILMELSEAIVLRIKQLLKEKNMKTYDLSIKSGVPRSTISLFLSRETKTIRLENLLYLCEGFGIELKDFFNDEVFKNVEAKNWLKNPED